MGQAKQIIKGAGKQIGDRKRALERGKLFLAQIAVDHGEICADRLGKRLGVMCASNISSDSVSPKFDKIFVSFCVSMQILSLIYAKKRLQ